MPQYCSLMGLSGHTEFFSNLVLCCQAHSQLKVIAYFPTSFPSLFPGAGCFDAAGSVFTGITRIPGRREDFALTWSRISRCRIILPPSHLFLSHLSAVPAMNRITDKGKCASNRAPFHQLNAVRRLSILIVKVTPYQECRIVSALPSTDGAPVIPGDLPTH